MKIRLLAMLVVLGAVSSSATAAPLINGFSLQQYDSTYAQDHFFAVPDAYVDGKLRPGLKLLANYSYKPLRIIDEASGDVLPNGEVVRNQLYFNFDISFSLAERIRFDIGIPFLAWQDGQDWGSGQVLQNAQLADMRLGGRIALLGKARDIFSLGLQADVWLPTGDKDNFTSDDGVRGHPRLIASGLVGEMFLYSVAAGALIREEQDLGLQKQGTAFTYSAGVAALLWDNRLQIGPEVFGSTIFAANEYPVEAMLGARLRLPGGFVLGLAGSAGLSKAPGTPIVRGLASLAWEPEEVNDIDEDGILDRDDACPRAPGVRHQNPRLNGCPEDRDDDGIADRDDACPDTPGLKNPDPRRNGCPSDRDNDGIIDAIDACPDKPGLKNIDPKLNGCPPPPPPPDRDRDGIADENDACPDTPGLKSDDPKLNGCPPPLPDRDKDGIADEMDGCPDEFGVTDPDPRKNGCPKLAQLTKEKITFTRPIEFAFKKAIILPAGEEIVKAVGDVLNEHPEVLLVNIEGHTDNKGTRKFNIQLSSKRANAVRQWLIRKAGIAPARLTANGFGPDKPVASNDDEEGRSRNRRVEFIVVKTSEPEKEATPPTP